MNEHEERELKERVDLLCLGLGPLKTQADVTARNVARLAEMVHDDRDLNRRIFSRLLKKRRTAALAPWERRRRER